jgi:anti-sigma factor RsiW
MTDPQHAIWLARIARYIEGTLPAEELKPLEEALRTDSALRRLYLEYVNLNSAIAAGAALPEHEFAGIDQQIIEAISVTSAL